MKPSRWKLSEVDRDIQRALAREKVGAVRVVHIVVFKQRDVHGFDQYTIIINQATRIFYV